MHFLKKAELAVFLIFFVLMSSCASQRNVSSTSSEEGIRLSDLNIEEVEDSPLSGNTPDYTKPISPQSLPPNSCLIIGEIKQVKSVEESAGYGLNRGKCGKEPCFASVSINKVIQTGMGVTTTLSKGQEIIIYFPSSLNGIQFGKTNLSSLTVEDQFSGLLLLTESDAEWSTEGITYEILKYTKL